MSIWARVKRLGSTPPHDSFQQERDRLVRSKLCQQCSRAEKCLIREAKDRQHLNGLESDLAWTLDHYTNYKELKRSASKGCDLCLLLEKALRAEHGADGAFLKAGRDPKQNNWFEFRLKPDILPSQGSCNLLQYATRRGDVWLQFALLSEENSEAHEVGQFIGKSLESEPDLGFASACFQRCLEHDAGWCVPKETLDFECPKRLIEIKETNVGVQVRLIETKGEAFKYAALSHRWGNDKESMTTKSNVKDRLKSIDASDLSLTFQHSFVVTAQMGLAYLWIDALAIVQDDERDWQEECPKMASIYQNSAFTIFAADSKSVDLGLIYRRPTDNDIRSLSCDLCYRNAAGKPASVVTLSHCSWYPFFDHTAPEAGSILKDRGWITQERTFSPRRLYFGNGQMYWECNGGRWLEGVHRNSPTRTKNPETESWHTLRMVIMLKGFWPWWMDFVEEYSACSLTYIQDRLPAISGIVNHAVSCTGYAYAAGLWEEMLLECLLWKRKGYKAEIAKQTDGYVAPSWSWASYPLGCEFPHGRSKTRVSLFTTLATNTTLLGSDPYGKLQAAALEVVGLTKVFSEFKITDGHGLLLSPFGTTCEVTLEYLNGDHKSGSSPNVRREAQHPVKVVLLSLDFAEGTVVHLWRMQGLAIEIKSTGGGKSSDGNVYERIGYVAAREDHFEFAGSIQERLQGKSQTRDWTAALPTPASSVDRFKKSLVDKGWIEERLEIV